MMEKLKGHGDKIKWGLAVGYMIVATFMLFIKEVTVPRMADGRTMEQTLAIHEVRLGKIEIVMDKLNTFERETSAMSEAICTLKVTVDRIERKIDAHMVGKED